MVETKEKLVQEIVTEETDFSELVGTSKRNRGNKIPVESYNRKVNTHSALLEEVFCELTGNKLRERIDGLLIKGIREKNPALADWLNSKGKVFKQEFGKPITLEEAKKNLQVINKARNFINKKFGANLKILQE